ncbi:MAG: hypothetical protein K6F56_06550 [Oscillospiraceae bacterium]|nr:hypothetical protein [Oscillospiraceae bacterium]
MNPSGTLPQRLRSSVSWRGLYAAGAFLLLCFALLGLIAPQRSADLFEVYGRFLLAALFGVFLFKMGLTREWAIRFYLAYLVWLLLTRWLQRDFYLFVDRELVRAEILSFVLFSAGAVLSPDGRRRLLGALSLVYGGFFVFFSLLGVFVALTNTYIHVPPENVWITMRSEGHSFSLLNLLSSFRLVTAARLYLAFMLLLYQFLSTRKKVFRVLLVLGMLILYAASALCFSRTIRVCFSISFSMLAMLLLWRYLRLRGPALRILAMTLAFVVVLPLTYKSFEYCLLSFNSLLVELAPRFEQRYEASAHKLDPDYFGVVSQPVFENEDGQALTNEQAAAVAAASVYDEKFSDTRDALLTSTFSNRTLIWKSAFVVAFHNPRILLSGQLSKTVTQLPTVYLKQTYNASVGPNMHNCFCQALLLTGLPGFLLALAWALSLVTRMIRMFFSRAEAVPLHLAFLSIPLTGMLLYTQMEYELFPAWDSCTKAFLLLAGVFLGLYREYYPAKAKAPAPAAEAE